MTPAPPEERPEGAPARRSSTPPRHPRGERTLTASEAAALIGVSIATVRGWADSGLIPSHRTAGGHRRFDPAELKDWLRRRGAAAAASGRRAVATDALPPCPMLARELNARIDRIVDRVLAGYGPAVPTPYRDDEIVLARAAARFVRSVAGALEAGAPLMFAGRMELAGVRASLDQDGVGTAVAQHVRIAAAVASEAEHLAAEGAPIEDESIACLMAVVDHACAALARGLCAAPPAGS